MAEIEFIYNGVPTTVQCNHEDKLIDILAKLSTKIEINLNSVYFLYSGQIIESKEKTFIEMANNLDKERNKMNIQINDMEKNDISSNSIIKSKQIICPECHESCLIDIIDYRIRLYDCINGHDIDRISLDNYENTQEIDESKIICNDCENVNKTNSYNKIFYRCNVCKKNLCPLCKEKHDKSHIIIDYNDKNFICPKYNLPYSLYCKSCKNNLCISCEMEHNKHEILSLGKMIQKKEKLVKKLEDYKNIKDKFTENIVDIIKQLNLIIKNVEILYKISKDILSKEQKYLNYETLHNVNESNIDYYFEYINKINNDKDINTRFINNKYL